MERKKNSKVDKSIHIIQKKKTQLDGCQSKQFERPI